VAREFYAEHLWAEGLEFDARAVEALASLLTTRERAAFVRGFEACRERAANVAGDAAQDELSATMCPAAIRKLAPEEDKTINRSDGPHSIGYP
jgi:hypothetical protein